MALLNSDKLLQTYSLEELLEMNDLTEEDVVEVLIEQDMIRFVKPVDYD